MRESESEEHLHCLSCPAARKGVGGAFCSSSGLLTEIFLYIILIYKKGLTNELRFSDDEKKPFSNRIKFNGKKNPPRVSFISGRGLFFYSHVYKQRSKHFLFLIYVALLTLYHKYYNIHVLQYY